MPETPTPYLPARDPEQRRRREYLQIGRAQYQFTNDRVAGVPMSAGLPEPDAFRNAWWNMRNDLDDLVANHNALGPILMAQVPLTLDEHASLYPVLKEPDSVKFWENDAFFAEQRLSGPNPLSLQRVDPGGHTDETVISEDHVAPALDDGETLATLADEGRLYELNFSKLLEEIPEPSRGGTDDGFGCPRPIALFKLGKDEGLLPIAIQVSPRADRVYTPKSNDQHWLLAKLCVQVADANFHQMFWHLGRTHFVLERVAVAAGGTLAPNHPVRILLDAHLRYVLAINLEATTNLMQPLGPVDQLFAGSLGDSRAIAALGANTWNLAEAGLPASLEARGVADLQNYSFAEDARLIWAEIRRYVGSYLSLYYEQGGENPPVRDLELRAFLAVLQHGGRVAGISKSAHALLPELADLLTTAIYTSSAVHAAVNYPQYEYEGFAPNMPFAVYDDRERFFRQSDPTRHQLEEFLKDYLPKSRSAGMQIELSYTLSHFRYDRLGEYDRRLVDPAARAAQIEFLERLRLVESEITTRNQSRAWPYLYLLPSNIPNSTSI